MYFSILLALSLRMVYGYARCSLAEEKGQDLNRQVRELKAAGAEEIVTEREHGDAGLKQNLELLLDAAQAGDTLICTEVSRLSRSTQQLCGTISTIREKRMRLVIVGSITVDCRNGQLDLTSQAFIQTSAVLRSWSFPSSAPVCAAAWPTPGKRARRIGRPQTTKEDIPAVFYRHYPAYSAGKLNISELARVCGLSRPTVYKYLALIAG